MSTGTEVCLGSSCKAFLIHEGLCPGQVLISDSHPSAPSPLWRGITLLHSPTAGHGWGSCPPSCVSTLLRLNSLRNGGSLQLQMQFNSTRHEMPLVFAPSTGAGNCNSSTANTRLFVSTQWRAANARVVNTAVPSLPAARTKAAAPLPETRSGMAHAGPGLGWYFSQGKIAEPEQKQVRELCT